MDALLFCRRCMLHVKSVRKGAGMTAEKAIKNLYAIRTVYQMDLSEPEDRALAMAIEALEYDDIKYHEEHGEVIVDKNVWEDMKKALGSVSARGW